MPRVRDPKKVNLPENIEVEIEKFSHDGRGIARHHGRVVMVSEALPGDRCVVKIEHANSKLWQGRVVKWVAKTEQRQAPICKLYGTCGGCQQQHILHADQITLKQHTIVEHLSRNGLPSVKLDDAVVSSESGYRHRARFHISKAGRLGFHAQKANTVVPVETCPILSPELQASVQNLTDNVTLKGLEQLEVVVDDFKQPGLKVVKGSQKAIEGVESWAEDQGWSVRTELRYKSGTQVVTANPGEFTQVNRQVNSDMINRIQSWLNVTNEDRILDLFCGNGNLSVALADQVAQVLGYEFSDNAIAQANALELSNATFEVVNLFTDDLHLRSGLNDFEPTIALLDPPRAGAEHVCRSVRNVKSLTKLLYVSCDPATLARDLKILKEDNWHLRKVALVDMFPQTRHIETMVLLEK